MLLILLLKILFSVLIVSHCIRWVSYHIRNYNKKTRVFHGNTRMPFDVEFALMYGFLRRRKKRVKDVSYRKPLDEWMQMLDTIYPQDNLNLTTSTYSNLNSNSVDENRKQFPFQKSKTGNNNFRRIKKIYTVFTAKPCAKNNGLVSSLLVNTKIVSINNLKISQNPMPFPKQTVACNSQIVIVWLRFYFKLINLFTPIIKFHQQIFHSHLTFYISPLTFMFYNQLNIKKSNVVKTSFCVNYLYL